MDEIEIISTKENIKKIENLSLEELLNYKNELLLMIENIENEIKKRQDNKKSAEQLFKK